MQVYKKMCMRGIEATDTTYTALISAYAKAERLDDALAAYQIMVHSPLYCVIQKQHYLLQDDKKARNNSKIGRAHV